MTLKLNTMNLAYRDLLDLRDVALEAGEEQFVDRLTNAIGAQMDSARRCEWCKHWGVRPFVLVVPERECFHPNFPRGGEVCCQSMTRSDFGCTLFEAQ